MHATNDSLLINRIRDLAGQIGATRYDVPEVADAENHESQVQIGLACSAVEILDHDSSRVIEWFGHCLIACGLRIDRSTESLLYALEAEMEIQRHRSSRA